jgi:hypothetical protein
MEDHKLMNLSFGTNPLLSLEIDPDVLRRQKFNSPLACIKPTPYSTGDFVVRKRAIYQEAKIDPNSNSIVWFDMTDADTIRSHLDTFGLLLLSSQPGDIVRMTVDVDEKTLSRRMGDEAFDTLQERRFVQLQELLGADMKPGARQENLIDKLGVAKLVSYAFCLVAEKAFERSASLKFEPISSSVKNADFKPEGVEAPR